MRYVEILLSKEVPLQEIRSILEEMGAYSVEEYWPGRYTLERKTGTIFFDLEPAEEPSSPGDLTQQAGCRNLGIQIGHEELSDALVFEAVNKLLTRWSGVVVGAKKQWSLDEVIYQHRASAKYPWVEEENDLARKTIEKLKKERKGPFKL